MVCEQKNLSPLLLSKSLGIPLGASIQSLKTDDIITLSKKTFAFFLGHETIHALTKIYFVKIDQNNQLKAYFAVDLPGTHEMGEQLRY